MPCFSRYMIPSRIIHLVLCALTVCFFLGSHAVPVVFPSFTTNGFAYITDAEELITIPAAFGQLLCSPSGESVDFTPANKSCSRIVFFTSRNSVTFEFLNLSSNGVVQPITSTPQVMSSHEVLNLCWAIPNDRDYDRTCRTDDIAAQATTEGPSSSQSEQGLDDLISNDEDSNEVQLRRLKQDASGVAGPPAVDDVPPDVREANKTSGFLDSSGAVMPNFNFVVELYLEGLPEQELISLEFEFDDNITRSLLIYVDSSNVSVDIQRNEAPKEDLNEGSVRYELDVIFSTRIVSRQNDEEAFSCPNVTRPMHSLIAAAQFSGGQHSLTPNHLTAVVIAAHELSTCPRPPKKLHEASCVSIEGVNTTFVSNETDLDVCGFTNGRTPWSTFVKAEFSIEKGQKRNVTVTVTGNAIVSLFGMTVPRSVKIFNFTAEPYMPGGAETSRKPGSPTEFKSTGRGSIQGQGDSNTSMSDDISVETMRKLGTAVSSSTGVVVGLSLVVSLGVPFLTFFTSAGEPALMSEVGCLSSAVDLMQIGQRVYLMTKLAVPNLPRNFIAFGEQFAWTLLDFRDPWETRSHSDNESDTSHSERRRLLCNDTSSEDDDIGVDPYSKLRGTYFWTGVAMACACVLHVVLLVIFVAYKDRVPRILRVPRLELYLSHTFIAVVAEGPAYLFSGSTRQIFIGVSVLAVGVIPLATFYIRTLRKYLFYEERPDKRIVYTISHVDVSEPATGRFLASAQANSSNEQALIPSVEEPPLGERPYIGNQRWFPDYITSALFGFPYRSGEWTWRDGRAIRVIDRYGPVFEDYRGKPMLERIQSEQAGPREMGVQRRQFEPVQDERRYAFDVCAISFRLRISEKAISLATQVFVTVLILGEDNPESNHQAALLLAVQVIYVAYLRLFRPHCSRWKLGVAMFERMLDTTSLFLVVCKINQDRSSTHEDIGTAMTVVEITSITMQLIDIAVTLWPICKKVKKYLWDGEPIDEEARIDPDSMEDPNRDGFEEVWCRNSGRFLLELKVIQPVNELYQSIRGGRSRSAIEPNHNHEANGNGMLAPLNAEAEQPTG